VRVIEAADARLREWLAEKIAADVALSVGRPDAPFPEHGVGFYLLEIIPAPPARATQAPPFQIFLRYLITTADPDATVAHKLLGTLVFAALADETIDVEPAPVPLEMWRAFGVPPRPALVVRLPLRIEREQRVAPRVRQPLEIGSASLDTVLGVVVGPGDLPVMNARVEELGTGVTTLTDYAGRFRFARLPVQGTALRFRVSAKGVQTDVVRERGAEASQRMTIRLPIEEA
jgi:hypothetical protein